MAKEDEARILSNSESKPFEAKTIELLTESGYHILNLQGWNLDNLKATSLNYELEFAADRQQYSFKLERAIVGQIAVHPEAFWIPESDHRSLSQQLESALKLNISLSQIYPGVKVEMGHLTDWLSIAYLFEINNEGKPFFKDTERRIRTLSSPSVDRAAYIGVKPNQLNPDQLIISVNQSPHFMPNPAIHAGYFLRAI